MNGRRYRWVGLMGIEGGGRANRRSASPTRQSGGPVRFAGGLLGLLAVLAVGLFDSSRSRGQEAQPPAQTKDESGPVPQAPSSADALSTRYRFSEKYALKEDPNRPELITQYQVGHRETRSAAIEKPQGAPERTEATNQLIYVERPARVSKIGEATDVVRRYDAARITTSWSFPLPSNPPYLEGLNIWYRSLPGHKFQAISLTENRSLREAEYVAISRQLFFPQLTGLLPPTPQRVLDTWKISPAAASSLLLGMPDPEDVEMEGTLSEVRKVASGTSLVATIEITGHFLLDNSPSDLRALLTFTFEPTTSIPLSGAPGSGPGIEPKASGGRTGKRGSGIDQDAIDARGWISEVRLGQDTTVENPDGNGRLKTIHHRELRLARRPLSSAPNQPGAGTSVPLIVPDPPPVENEANSWLIYDDPKGRFHFRHPQSMSFQTQEEDEWHLSEVRPDGGKDFLVILFPPQDSNPERNRARRDPESLRRNLNERMDKARAKFDVLKGSSDWLPDPDWLPLKRRVYRIEVALQPKATDDSGRKAARTYVDYYLVQFTQNECIQFQSWTDRNDHIVCRNQTETLIKGFELGPSPGHPQRSEAGRTPAPDRSR